MTNDFDKLLEVEASSDSTVVCSSIKALLKALSANYDSISKIELKAVVETNEYLIKIKLKNKRVPIIIGTLPQASIKDFEQFGKRSYARHTR